MGLSNCVKGAREMFFHMWPICVYECVCVKSCNPLLSFSGIHVLCLLAAGKWWWSSSQQRWCWGFEGNAAAGPTETRRSPERPPSVPATLSSPPLPRSPWIGKEQEVDTGTAGIVRDAFTAPGLRDRLTLALASRLASASAAMALWSWVGSLTSLISTRSTLMPQSSVASSRLH